MHVLTLVIHHRDLEHDDCINFVTLVVNYARIAGEFDVDTFYKKHRDDLVEMSMNILFSILPCRGRIIVFL
jgi:hypothetical protein